MIRQSIVRELLIIAGNVDNGPRSRRVMVEECSSAGRRACYDLSSPGSIQGSLDPSLDPTVSHSTAMKVHTTTAIASETE